MHDTVQVALLFQDGMQTASRIHDGVYLGRYGWLEYFSCALLCPWTGPSRQRHGPLGQEMTSQATERDVDDLDRGMTLYNV